MKKHPKKAAKKAAKNPPGRPPKVGEKMTDRIHVPVKPSEKQRYQEAAARAGLDVAAWIRLVCNKAAEDDGR